MTLSLSLDARPMAAHPKLVEPTRTSPFDPRTYFFALNT